MISVGINLVMTVIGFLDSTMFIVFVCSRLICARIQSNASRRSFGIASGSGINMLEWGLHYVEPLLVANFPVKKYSDAFFSSSKDAHRCTVCLAEYREDDALRVLPYCGHFFHASCIDIWLQQHPTCPVCRVSLRQYPEKKRLMQPMYSSVIRSHHGMACIETNSYHCTSTSNGLSSRAHSNRLETIKEAQFPSEGVGKVAGESTSILIDGGQIAKHSRNKHVENPSNP